MPPQRPARKQASTRKQAPRKQASVRHRIEPRATTPAPDPEPSTHRRKTPQPATATNRSIRERLS
jgi:hypothetical protein